MRCNLISNFVSMGSNSSVECRREASLEVSFFQMWCWPSLAGLSSSCRIRCLDGTGWHKMAQEFRYSRDAGCDFIISSNSIEQRFARGPFKLCVLSGWPGCGASRPWGISLNRWSKLLKLHRNFQHIETHLMSQAIIQLISTNIRGLSFAKTLHTTGE